MKACIIYAARTAVFSHPNFSLSPKRIASYLIVSAAKIVFYGIATGVEKGLEPQT
uniref:Uncharacterized protein n=1 Tax=Anguilla anguilla TaxID=7936 RepID=A0A0E9Q3D4_ANGAN